MRVERVLTQLNQLIWGQGMTVLLILSALYFVCFARRYPLMRVKRRSSGEQKSKDAFFTALAGTLGIGGMVGVAAALAMGGAGAVFWMGVSALAGMVLKYVEVTLSCASQVKTAQGWRGGAMVILEKLRHPAAAACFCLCCMAAAFAMGALVPASSVCAALHMAFDLPPWISAAAFALAAAVVLRGRGQAILKANRVLIPLATLLYVGMCLWIIFTHAERIGTIGEQILREALDFSAAASGGSGFALGKAVRYGVSRGIFSHEAGMGSAPLSYASAPVSDPARQGLMGVAEVFVDTFLVCMLTAFALLIIGIDGYGQDGMTLMMTAFSRAIGPAGPALIAFFIVLFAFPCVLGWYYYASVCLTYLSGSTLLADGYRLSFLLMIAAGAMLSGSLIWEISDLLNGCMTVLNLAALFLARRLTDP